MLARVERGDGGDDCYTLTRAREAMLNPHAAVVPLAFETPLRHYFHYTLIHGFLLLLIHAKMLYHIDMLRFRHVIQDI